MSRGSGTPLKAVLAALVAAASGSVLLAACGNGLAAKSGATSTLGVPAAATGHPHQASRHELALVDARGLLGRVPLPPAAEQVARLGGQLSNPPQTIGGNLVDLHRFFTVKGSRTSALRFFQQHPPTGSRKDGSGSVGSVSTGVTLQFLVFEWPPTAGLFNNREVIVTAVQKSPDLTGLRIDAQVTWLPAKPPGDVVLAGATQLTVSLSSGPNPGATGRRVTTSSPSLIAAIRSRINRLGVLPPGNFSCPVDSGQQMTMIFRRAVHSSPLAVVRADSAGCETVSVTEGGQTAEPVLSGRGLVAYVESELSWRS